MVPQRKGVLISPTGQVNSKYPSHGCGSSLLTGLSGGGGEKSGIPGGDMLEPMT